MEGHAEPGASDKNKAVGVCILVMQEQDKFVELVVSIMKKAVCVCILPMQDMFVGLGVSVERNKVMGASILSMLDKFVELGAGVKDETEDTSILLL